MPCSSGQPVPFCSENMQEDTWVRFPTFITWIKLHVEAFASRVTYFAERLLPQEILKPMEHKRIGSPASAAASNNSLSPPWSAPQKAEQYGFCSTWHCSVASFIASRGELKKCTLDLILVTSASLLVTSALLLVAKSY